MKTFRNYIFENFLKAIRSSLNISRKLSRCENDDKEVF